MTTDITELRKLVAEMTPGEWCYRPLELDDWGFIRSALSPEYVVATSRGPQSAKSQDDHRRDKTDPFEPNGRAIVAAVRLLRAVVEPNEKTVEAISAAVEAAEPSYSLDLVAMERGGQSFYRLRLSGEPEAEFVGYEAAHDHIRSVRAKLRSRAVLATIAALGLES